MSPHHHFSSVLRYSAFVGRLSHPTYVRFPIYTRTRVLVVPLPLRASHHISYNCPPTINLYNVKHIVHTLSNMSEEEQESTSPAADTTSDWSAEPHEESEEVMEGFEVAVSDEATRNPFGFLFSPAVTQCFAKEPVEVDHIVFFSGNSFTGNIEEGIVNGDGRYVWSDSGTTYDGTFDWGSFTGSGSITWKDGSSYEGELNGGKIEGQGVYTCRGLDGFVYDGKWKNGMFNGFGTCYYGEFGCACRYVGNFGDCAREGNGTMYYRGGNVYEGEWHLGKRHGTGKFTWAENGSYYTGEFIDGVMSGKGEMVYGFSSKTPSIQFVQANRYLGEFADSQRAGQGTFFYANGAVYKGDWAHNLKHGNGTFTSRDGRVYEAEFRDGAIFQDGKSFVPTPSISLNFPLVGLLTAAEALDEVTNALCSIYVRFLPKLSEMYQQYAKIQWTDNKTVNALRIVGMWRMLQERGTVISADFRLSDADDVIGWSLQKQSLEPVLKDDVDSQDAMTPYVNEPLIDAPDPFATLYMYQMFEGIVRLAHNHMVSKCPDSIVSQVTRFLETCIFMDAPNGENEWSIFRESLATEEFDALTTKHSKELNELYLDFCGFASGSSRFQARQIMTGLDIDRNIDVITSNYQGIMSVRDLIIFFGEKGFFGGSEHLTVMDVLLFLRFSSVTRAVEEEEIEEFKANFLPFTACKVTFLEFVQCLSFVAERIVDFDWTISLKFEYVVDHIGDFRAPEAEEGH